MTSESALQYFVAGEETLLEKKPETQETQALALTKVLEFLWLFSEAVQGKQTEFRDSLLLY